MLINEIFPSIDGEINKYHQGALTLFVRFSGCSFSSKCLYCDTDYEAFQEMSVNEVVKKIESFGINKLTITGGEPLMQKDLRKLIFSLTERQFLISIETNGTIKIPIDVLYLANWVMDIKLPSSGNSKYILPIDYYKKLPKNVYFKFCVGDMKDYELAKGYLSELKNNVVAISPIISEDKQWPKKLAEAMVADRLPCVYNLQIHKYLNVK